MAVELTKDLEKRLGEKIDELANIVVKKKGEVVLSYREIYGEPRGRGGIVPPMRDVFHHFELGVISGALVDRIETSVITSLDLHGTNFESSLSYPIFEQFGIPVLAKLTKTSSYVVDLDFNYDDLKRSKQGEICFGISEVFRDSISDVVLSSRRNLGEFGLKIGDEEVSEFLKRYPLVDKSDLFVLLKQPGEIERRVRAYEDKSRENMFADLVRSIARVSLLDKEVIDIEDVLLRATGAYWRDEDGEFFEWDRLSRDEVPLYEKLHGQIIEHMSSVESILEKVADGSILDGVVVSGRPVGFPTNTRASVYLASVKETLSNIKGRLNRINAHLNEKKAR